jgi:hypothetical protein
VVARLAGRIDTTGHRDNRTWWGYGGTIVRLTGDLDDTVIARWYRTARFRPDPARRESGGVLQRTNWQTRTRYYETLVGLLDISDDAADGLARETLTAAAGQRRPSTLYYLVSPKSAGSLAGTLLTAPRPRLYERRRGEGAVDLLIIETKVWSYWPYREGWLTALDDLAITDRWLAAASLVRVLADWAMQTPSLATAAAFAPPVAAVEDLLLLADGGRPHAPGRPRDTSGGDMPGGPGASRPDGGGPAVDGGPAARAAPGLGRSGGSADRPRGPWPAGDPLVAAAAALLTTVVRTALGSSGIGPGFVLDAVHPGLTRLVPAARPAPDMITAEVSDVLTQLEHTLRWLSAGERAGISDELGPRLRAILDLLAAPAGPAVAPGTALDRGARLGPAVLPEPRTPDAPEPGSGGTR